MDPTYRGLGVPVPSSRPKGGGFAGRMTLIIIILVIAVIGGGALMFLNQDKSKALQPKLAARLDTLQKIIAEGTKNAKSGDLRKINSDISIQVLSDTATIDAKLKAAGTDKPDGASVAAEADTATFTSLKNAALDNHFDSTYQKVIAEKLESTNALVRELYDKSSNKDLRSALNDTYTHFKLLQNQLAATSS